MWHALSGNAHKLQDKWPQLNAVSFFLSMQIEQICASSSAWILLMSFESSILFVRVRATPVCVIFSLIDAWHSMHRLSRTLQSKQQILCLHGRNVIAICSSSHSLHLLALLSVTMLGWAIIDCVDWGWGAAVNDGVKSSFFVSFIWGLFFFIYK